MKYLLFALAAWPALAQNISVGVRGGIPLTDAFHTVSGDSFNFTTARPNYVVGPTFEVRLPFGLGFHADALYRKISVAGTTVGPLGSATSSDSFSFWQFPVMVKWRMGAGPFRPFISGGPSFSKLSGVGDAAACLFALGSQGCAGKVVKSSGTGVAFGAGLDLKIPVIRLAPEIRYTHLGANFFEGGSGASLASQRNQIDVLIGVTF